MTEERHLAAIMFCDVCGYSRIMGENETRALAVIGMAGSCIESAVGTYGGRVIKKLGDGLLCEFPSAVNAVRCAIEIQRAVAEHDLASEPAQQFQMRIGIHVGDVVVADGDILGDGVNVASRIQPLAEPGGICISRDVFDLVKSRVSIETVNLGPHDLKNISRQIDIYKVLINAVEGGSPPARRFILPLARSTPVADGRHGSLSAPLPPPRCCWPSWPSGMPRRRDAPARRPPGGAATGRRRKDRGRHSAPESLPPEIPEDGVAEKIDGDVAQLELRLARETVADRQRRFFKAVSNDDRNTALRMLDPEATRTADLGAVWIKCRTMAGLLKWTGSGPDNFRIESVDVAPDCQSARVWMKLFRKTAENPEGAWNDIPPSEWRKAQDEWYLHVEPKPARSDTGQHEMRRVKKPLMRP